MRCKQYGHNKGKRRANNAALPHYRVHGGGTLLGRCDSPVLPTRDRPASKNDTRWYDTLNRPKLTGSHGNAITGRFNLRRV